VLVPVSIQNLTGGVVNLHEFAVGVGYLGAALGVAMVVPQIVRTLRNRTLPGVSVMSWALMALACLTWMLYGFRAGEVPQIPGNILMVAGSAVIVVAVPSAISPVSRALRLAAPALLLIALAVVLPTEVIGFLGFGIGLISGVPQLIASFTRARRGASAVSIPAWVLRAFSQACWLFYALVLHDVSVSISATFLLVSSIVLVAGERTSTRAAKQPVLSRT
jgi:uncharacterized protein with PQ loop repeat